MKPNSALLRSRILIPCVLALTSIFGQAQPQDVPLPEIVRPIPLPPGMENAIIISENTWWARHYVEGLGLAPFDEGIVAAPKVKDQEKKAAILTHDESGGFKAKQIEAEDVPYPFADAVPGRRNSKGEIVPIYIPGQKTGPLIMFRLQDDLSSKPFDAQPGAIIWTQDAGTSSNSTMINAALLVDLYFSGVDLFGQKRVGGYTSNAMVHFIAGAELEQFDSGNPATDYDIRRYMAVAEFSPGGLFNIPKLPFIKDQDLLRQTMTLGWMLEDNVLQDVQRNSLQIKYAPAFKMPTIKLPGIGKIFDTLFVGERSFYRGFFDFLDPKEIEDAATKQALVNNLVSAPQSARQADKATGKATNPNDEWSRSRLRSAAPLVKSNLDHYFYLRPKLGIDLGQSTFSSVLGGDIPSLNAIYTVETGLSFYKESFHLGYRINGFAGLDGGSNRVSHEFFLQATPHGWPGRVFASYKKGKIAPAFNDVDFVQVGLGFKF